MQGILQQENPEFDKVVGAAGDISLFAGNIGMFVSI
jgi:hypothetical protein